MTEEEAMETSSRSPSAFCSSNSSFSPRNAKGEKR